MRLLFLTSLSLCALMATVPEFEGRRREILQGIDRKYAVYTKVVGNLEKSMMIIRNAIALGYKIEVDIPKDEIRQHDVWFEEGPFQEQDYQNIKISENRKAYREALVQAARISWSLSRMAEMAILMEQQRASGV